MTTTTIATITSPTLENMACIVADDSCPDAAAIKKTINIWNDDNVSTGSADSSTTTTTGSTCHECSTTTGVLNNNTLLLSSSEELLQQTFRWMFWSPQHLVKDDVFLAPLINIDIKQIDDNTATTMTSTTTIPTPCLSPVTSPSDFLYDHEPLFDGIDYDEQLLLTDQPESSNKDDEKIKNDVVSNQKITGDPVHNSEDDLDWSALLSQFTSNDPHDYYDSFLPPTPSTAIEEEEEEQFVIDELSMDILESQEYDEYDDEYEEEDDEDEYKELPVATFSTTISLKQNKKQNTKRKTIKRKSIELEEHIILDNSSKKAKHSSLTVFENLTQSGIDWCRYCGTTEGVNWRPGPWGKRTLCNKHGCDYKGYGLASRLPRLDLSAFAKEKLEDRRRPIVQQFCVICQSPEKNKENKLIPCEGGCSRAYHRVCHPATNTINSQHSWYCNSMCQENKQRNRVVVDLPRKYLPLMRLQQQQHKKSLLSESDHRDVQKKSSHSTIK